MSAPLSTTARVILTEFADAFPESAHYRGGRKLRKGGWERAFPRIESDVDAKEAFLDAVDELVRLGLLSVKWKRFREGTEVEALYLEDPESLFELVGRASPESLRAEMLAVLASDPWSDAGSDLLAAVRTHLCATLEARHPVPVEDGEQLRDLARLFRLTPTDAQATPIRALSVRLFSDSKRLERLLPVADRLSRRAVGTAFSADVGLARTYPEASLALLGTLVVRGAGASAGTAGVEDRVRWRCVGEVVTLPAETIERLAAVELGADSGSRGRSTPAVLSVENKESFHVLAARLRAGALPDGFRAVAYCGGHPHRSYIDLLELLASGGAELYHFGDLDPDGILIFAELQRGLDAAIRPFLMDVGTYRRYLLYGYDPPPARLELLASLRAGLPQAIEPLAAAILERRTGVEQEVIDVTAEDAACMLRQECKSGRATPWN